MLFPGDLDSKTGQPVIDVLRDKHPVMRTPCMLDWKWSSFEDYAENPDVIPLNISEEDVMWVAGKLSGASGPSGKDVMAYQIWLLRFGQALTGLWEEMTAWTDWLENYFPH